MQLNTYFSKKQLIFINLKIIKKERVASSLTTILLSFIFGKREKIKFIYTFK